jgi:hypothetical protein
MRWASPKKIHAQAASAAAQTLFIFKNSIVFSGSTIGHDHVLNQSPYLAAQGEIQRRF